MSRLVSFPDLPLSSFWSLAVCKNGGVRPGPLYHANDLSVYLGRQSGGAILNWKNELEAFSCSFCPKCWSFKRWTKMCLSWFNMKNVCVKCVLFKTEWWEDLGMKLVWQALIQLVNRVLALGPTCTWEENAGFESLTCSISCCYFALVHTE